MQAHRKLVSLGSAFIVGLALMVPAAAYAVDVPATATITGGSLTLNATPPNAGFATTLNGTDQSIAIPQAFDVWDDTGSGTGWNITATSTAFTSGSHSLADSAVTVDTPPDVTADDGAGTIVPAVSTVVYPYTLPAGATAPAATELFNASTDSGLGHQTATASMALAIPRTTYSGTYTSTWTYSLVSAP